MPTTTHTPVLIVGAGPVGLALAGDLGWRGVACTLIEKTEGRVDHPKMDLIGVRTMEFCRRWGIADRVRDAPYPPDYPQDYVWLESFTGYEFGREKFPGRGFEPLPKESPQKRERVPQDMFDPIIKQWATEFPSVTLQHNTELVGFEDKGTHVAATVRDTRDRRDARDHRRLHDRHRRRRVVRARDARHSDERPPGADLHHQRDLPLPGPATSCTTRGTAIASSSSGRKAPG